MTTADKHAGAIPWRQLREFAAVDLAQSYVLSWHFAGDSLLIDVDVLLQPEHPFYEKPRPAEKVCIRPASIEFPCCDALEADAVEASEVIDIVKNLGHGAIADLHVLDDGRYEIEGDFGTVRIEAERPIFRLKGH